MSKNQLQKISILSVLPKGMNKRGGDYVSLKKRQINHLGKRSNIMHIVSIEDEDEELKENSVKFVKIRDKCSIEHAANLTTLMLDDRVKESDYIVFTDPDVLLTYNSLIDCIELLDKYDIVGIPYPSAHRNRHNNIIIGFAIVKTVDYFDRLNGSVANISETGGTPLLYPEFGPGDMNRLKGLSICERDLKERYKKVSDHFKADPRNNGYSDTGWMLPLLYKEEESLLIPELERVDNKFKFKYDRIEIDHE